MTFTPFDPLAAKNTQVNEAALGALTREISNILSSYVGWFDPFAELIQNALDSVEARSVLETSAGSQAGYQPAIKVIVDLDDNALTVSDNGVGLDQEKFQQFLAPNFSFKTGMTRGHKGVGATFVAYGFNYLRVTTRSPGFAASGRIIGARSWLNSSSHGTNPKVEPDETPLADDEFPNTDRGVSITVRFDDNTHPRQLDWIKASTAETWHKILSLKTGLGSITEDKHISVSIVVVSGGNTDRLDLSGTSYFWLHRSSAKSATVRDLEQKSREIFEKFGPGRTLPDKFRNLDFIYDTWTTEELAQIMGSSLDEEESSVMKKHTPTVSVEYGYTAKLWSGFNEGLKIRAGYRVLTAGIQLAANNMPQGEVITIPLNRNIGRQNQIHFLIHFNNYSPDLGRKGFHRELTDFAKTVSRHISESVLPKYRTSLKANTGVSPDLVRELKIGEWKAEMQKHEESSPLVLASEHFFKPTERVSITSAPTREQDVIALFNQLIAGGVIRGLSIMSTNERFTYDSLYRIAFDLDTSLYVHDAVTNPLGVPQGTAEVLSGKVTEPRILEYKFSLDGFIEDIDTHDKNIKDVDLCIVWETGSGYKERYGITSLLVPENVDQRQYHGVTHTLTDLESGARLCDLIVLEELISTLNDPSSQEDAQRSKYE
ncbi:hypothetical protein V8J38_14055 [Brevundimonas olei]|uniref:ATP-binding protein n=1 Tax=Brevundimonas olei TaxID=657642 RepID=A0ABZ2IFF7_9CAUL